ncbi:integral membrane protein [Apiospora phragmitis]|uniref:Integral membrane protein n=1 Tax=Apiospora phragmitis TaxID=2905665 RepID=A0ABR1TNF9_9PEZI
MGHALAKSVQRASPGSMISMIARDGAHEFSPGQPAVIVDTSIWTMFAISTIFMTLRFYCRLYRSGQLMRDDYVLAAGWACMLTSTSLLTRAMSLGYIDTVLGENTITLLARCAHTWQRYLVWFIIGSINIVFIGHILLLWRPFCGAETPTTCMLNVGMQATL